MNGRCLVGKQQLEITKKHLDLSKINRDVELFEKHATLKHVSTIVKNTLPSQESKFLFLIAFL